MITIASRGQLEELASRTGGEVPPAPAPEPEPPVAQEEAAPAPPARAPVSTPQVDQQLVIDAIAQMSRTVVQAIQASAVAQVAAPAEAAPTPLVERAAALQGMDAEEQLRAPEWRLRPSYSMDGLLERITARAPGRPTQVFEIERQANGLIDDVVQVAEAPQLSFGH